MISGNVMNGRDLMIFLADPNESPEKPELNSDYNKVIGFATSCKLTANSELSDITSKDHGEWDDKQQKKISWSLSSENLFTEEGSYYEEKDDQGKPTGKMLRSTYGFYDLIDYMMNKKRVRIVFASTYGSSWGEPESNSIPEEGWNYEAPRWIGYCYITSIECNAQDGELSTYSITLEGDSKLTTAMSR